MRIGWAKTKEALKRINNTTVKTNVLFANIGASLSRRFRKKRNGFESDYNKIFYSFIRSIGKQKIINNISIIIDSATFL